MNEYVKKVRALANREYQLETPESDAILMEGEDRLIKLEEATDGKLAYVFDELSEGSLNAIAVGIIENATMAIPMVDVASKFFYLIERRNKNGWEEVQNEDALQPVELIEKGILKENDIIRFRGIDGSIACEVMTDEEALMDLNGLFFVGVPFDEYSDYLIEMMEEAIDDDDDNDCDEDHHVHEPHIGVNPASTIIEYLHKNSSLIKSIGEEIDIIEAEEE